MNSIKLRYKSSIVWLTITSVLMGCSTTKEQIFSTDGLKTMKEVYADTVSSEKFLRDSLPFREIKTAFPVDYGELNQIKNKLDEQFPRLPNKELIIFVWPHLKGEMVVPGYYSKITLYEKNHFALPGELKSN